MDLFAMSPNDYFGLWQAARLDNAELKPMGKAGLQQASLIWRKWLTFCAAHSLDWDAAQASDVSAFCQAIGPRSKTKKTSPVTIRRYWRIIHDLYAHALASGIVHDNPALNAKPGDTERVPSLALPINMWIALREGLPSGHGYKDRRNRLVLLLMMRAALTVREIINLTIADAKPYEGSPEDASQALEHAGLPLLQPESSHWLALEAFPRYTLSVKKPRTLRPRLLLLDTRTSKALHDWLAVRSIGHIDAKSRLILGDKIGTAIAPKGLYNICKEHIATCLTHQGFMAEALPNTVLAEGGIGHLGPNTLRNTCIALWFNSGVPLEEVKRRCGFQDASVKSRLGVHLHSPFPI